LALSFAYSFWFCAVHDISNQIKKQGACVVQAPRKVQKTNKEKKHE